MNTFQLGSEANSVAILAIYEGIQQLHKPMSHLEKFCSVLTKANLENSYEAFWADCLPKFGSKCSCC